MSDQFENPEDRFSQNETHISYDVSSACAINKGHPYRNIHFQEALTGVKSYKNQHVYNDKRTVVGISLISQKVSKELSRF